MTMFLSIDRTMSRQDDGENPLTILSSILRREGKEHGRLLNERELEDELGSNCLVLGDGLLIVGGRQNIIQTCTHL